MKTFPTTPKRGNPSLKLLLLISIFLLPVVGSPLHSSPAVNEVKQVDTYCGVTHEEVVKYLANYGYTVSATEPEEGTCNAIATTQYEYQTRVLIEEGVILGWEDIQ